MRNENVELRTGRTPEPVPLPALAPDRAEPIAYMVSSLRSNKPVDGLTALDINVDVVEIIEAAKQSVASGRAVALPLPAE